MADVVRSTPEHGGPTSTSGRRLRAAAGVLLVGGTLALSGCSQATVGQLKRLGLPVAAGDRAASIHDLWIGSWIAAGSIGVLVWGLIIYVVVKFKRRKGGYVKQNRYNLPMEVFYTIAPFVVIGVLFYYTVLVQEHVQAKVTKPQHTIDVVGAKWAWTFNYQEAGNPDVGNNVYESGSIEHTPDLYLPINESVRFNLSSPDVIHDFWIPAFYEKMDVVPGRHNSFDVTPNRLGDYAGKCAEFCGTYHSAMLFNVHIVSEADYATKLKALAAKGQTGTAKGLNQVNSVYNHEPLPSSDPNRGNN